MATTKKTAAKKAEGKKKAAKAAPKQEVVETNPVDEFMKENAGKVLNEPKKKKTSQVKSKTEKPEDVEPVVNETVADITTEAAEEKTKTDGANKKKGKPKAKKAVKKEDTSSVASETASEEPKAEEITVEQEVSAENKEPDTVEAKESTEQNETPVCEQPAEVTDDSKPEDDNEVTLEASPETFKELIEKFSKEAQNAPKTETTAVAEKPSINVQKQPEPVNKVEKIPGEKAKRSFLNRVFTAMGLRQD